MQRLLLSVLLAAGLASLSLGAESRDSFAAGFQDPPAAARPKSLWFWMNGHVSKDGITRDLEAMHRVGIGGVLIFDGGPYHPPGPVGYLDPQWRGLMTHAMKEGRRLGIDIGMHNAPGWSSSGGPWVTPERSMQQLVWTETTVRGPQPVDVSLPQPQTNHGYYRDAFVLAFPALSGEEVPYEQALAKITSGSGRAIGRTVLSDGLLDTAVTVASAETLLFEFAEPIEVQAVTVNSTVPNEELAVTATSATQGRFPAVAIESSADGVEFSPICTVRSPGRHGIQAPGTKSFAAVRARFFRVVPASSGDLSEVVFHRTRRIEEWPFKANFAYRVGHQVTMPAAGDRAGAIDPATVVDVTDRLDEHGRLRWAAPAGAWTVLRIGHTTTGRVNVSASTAGTGLETDKLSRDATDFHFDHVIARVLAEAGPEAAKAFTSVSVDSYEAGMQNWTRGFADEFRRRAGYDLRPFLPAMLGRVVGDTAISERFLFDVRQVMADLMRESYYGRLAERCRERGLTLYVEGYGQGVFDELQLSGLPDVPMTEFWTRTPWAPNRTVKMVTSAAHVYGKPIVAAEAFTGEERTSRWLEYPYALKVLGDDMLAAGVNQMVFHRFAHQPHPTAVPGMAMGPWGFFFERTNTWFFQSTDWVRYLARCQQVLQQGHYVADVLYFVGERPPNNSQFLMPALPGGFNYDQVTADVLLNRVTVRDGRWVLPSGASYRLLMLPPGLQTMTPELMRKLRELVHAGAVVCGAKPDASPTLRGYPETNDEVQRIANELWTPGGAGRGRVLTCATVADAIAALALQPDFAYSSPRAEAELSWSHRRIDDADVYFVANRERLPVNVTTSFRMAGRQPEIWRPETGALSDAVICAANSGRTEVPLQLGPAESVFVVFRRPAEAAPRWLAKDGTTIIDAAQPAAPTPPAVRNTFTMLVWAKPDIELRLMPAESSLGQLDETGKSYVIPAAEGDRLFGPGHAMAGLAVGRNGAYVVERASGKSPAVVVEKRPIAGWTHFAVVYRDGRPRLYINGQLAREGVKSGDTIHPGIGAPPPFADTIFHFAGLADVARASGLMLPPSQGRAYLFEGNLTTAELVGEALSDEAIAAHAARGLPACAEPPPVELAATDDSIEGLFWQPGRYALEDGRAAEVNVAAPMRLEGAWEVQFPSDRGAPERVIFSELGSWHRHADAGVRNFSGTAVYTRTVEISAAVLQPDRRVVLDLGRVEVVAEVRVNGRECGLAWKDPYRIDITDAARPGLNTLEISVTNLWPNRLIGDEALPPENGYASTGELHGIQKMPGWYLKGEPKPAGGRVTFSTWQFFAKDEPLLESGLLGPVRVLNPVRKPFTR